MEKEMWIAGNGTAGGRDGGSSTRQRWIESKTGLWPVLHRKPQDISRLNQSQAAFILNWELTPMSTSVAAGLNLQAAGSCAI